MPIRAIITEGTTADCTKADELTRGLKTKYLVADTRKRKMVAAIPPRKHRKEKRLLHKQLYKKRHKVENTFMKMKQWREIATRYTKNLASFEAAVHICFIMLWWKFS